MQYRAMSTGDELSALGFGCMRLPQKNGRIDEERATRQLRSAIDRGVNYLDTAVLYHNGASEPFLGRALSGGYRDKVKLATKLPPWYAHAPEDMDATLKTQLDKLKTDHIDYYLVHGVGLPSWKKLKNLGFGSFVERAKADGRIRHIGFSCHAGKDDFVRIVDDFPWEFCQLQLNYLDDKNQAGLEGMRYAASKGLGIIAMEPLRGGFLGGRAPRAVQEVWDEAEPRKGPAEWALRWVWNLREVSVVLSGMNEESHIDENIRIAEEALPGSMTKEELALVGRAREAFRGLMKIGCTGCRYCMPCPAGVNIPGSFLSYDNKYLRGGGSRGGSVIEYVGSVGGIFTDDEPGYASRCIACGKCLEACPQHIDIPKRLAEVKKEFEGPSLRAAQIMLGSFFRFDRWRNLRKTRRATAKPAES